MRAVWVRHRKLLLWLWRSWIFAAAMAWMGLIFQLSSLSQEEASAPLEAPVIAWLGVARSYLAHLVLYGVLATMVQMNFWAWTNAGIYRLRWALLAAVFASFYGVTDEYHQSLVPGRVASLIDMVVNAVGATAGPWLFALASKRFYPADSAS